MFLGGGGGMPKKGVGGSQVQMRRSTRTYPFQILVQVSNIILYFGLDAMINSKRVDPVLHFLHFLSIRLSLFEWSSLCQSIEHICPSICYIICLSLSINMPVGLSIYLIAYPSVWLSVYLSVCQSASASLWFKTNDVMKCIVCLCFTTSTVHASNVSKSNFCKQYYFKYQRERWKERLSHSFYIILYKLYTYIGIFSFQTSFKIRVTI